MQTLTKAFHLDKGNTAPRADFDNHIKKLEDVGMANPFAGIKVKLKHTRLAGLCHEVYAESRYSYEQSPHCIYVPSTEVMLLLMRTCVGCESV